MISLIAGFVLLIASMAGGSDSILEAFAWFLGGISVLVIVLGIMYWLLIARLGRRLREVAILARQTWQSPSPTLNA